jgi:hypothetical protein
LKRWQDVSSSISRRKYLEDLYWLNLTLMRNIFPNLFLIDASPITIKFTAHAKQKGAFNIKTSKGIKNKTKETEQNKPLIEQPH